MGKSIKEIIEEAIYVATLTGRRATCTAEPPDWSHYQTIESLEAVFLEEVQRLISIYGEAATTAAFQQIIPDFDQQSPVDTLDLDTPMVPVESEEAPLMERKLDEGLITKAGKFFKNLFKGGGKKAPAAAKKAAVAGGVGAGVVGGALAGTGAGIASTAATSFINKDVDIANISTTDKLGVEIERGSAPWLEALLSRTNELIQQLTDLLSQSQPALSQGIRGMEDSIDNLIGIETGRSTDQVQTQQAMFGGAKRKSKKETTEKSKESAKKT